MEDIMSKVKIWEDYCTHFGLALNDIRPGCEPRVIMSDDFGEHAIVLVHGLTDSPYFMEAIGQYFHDEMGFNVFIPLLDGHGLKNPRGMKNVTLQKWIENVDFAIDTAKAIGDNVRVSIGGLSTGGALSVHRALFKEDDISGAAYLFSAALDLAGEYGDFLEGFLRVGLIKKIVARYDDKSFGERIQDILYGLGLAKNKGEENRLVGDNPFRYSRLDIDGAAQLAALIKVLDDEVKKTTLKQPIFVAHSACDTVADIEGVENLIANHPNNHFFRIEEQFQVNHASVVLKEDVMMSSKNRKYILEKKNPRFMNMMEAAGQFTLNNLEQGGK
jgi:esterase/lipase